MSEDCHSESPGPLPDDPPLPESASPAATEVNTLATLQTRNDQLAADYHALQQQLRELEAHNHRLTRQLASRDAMVSRQDAHQYVETRARARLETQTVELAEADRRKNQFLSLLGHELRNPLAPMRNALDLLAMGSEDPTTRDWAYRVIERQTYHLERMVQDLLDVAHINRGAITLQCQRQDVGALVREALAAVDSAMRERGHCLELELPATAVAVHGDATRLVQVFTNLLQNAAKYTDDGGLIRVALTAAADHVMVVITDNGRGLDEAIRPRLFDAFTQGPRSTGKAEGGLGLGLTLVKQLVMLHHGEVYAESDGAGQGSRFTVRLPLDRSTAAAVAPAATTTDAAPANTSQRILVVDDNPEVIDAMQKLLRALGHDVISVATGADALRAVVAYRPQIVLLDIGLPDIDGTEVARQLARLPSRASFKLVALSGYAAEDGGAGLFDAYLLKPAGRAALTQVLQVPEIN